MVSHPWEFGLPDSIGPSRFEHVEIFNTLSYEIETRCNLEAVIETERGFVPEFVGVATKSVFERRKTINLEVEWETYFHG